MSQLVNFVLRHLIVCGFLAFLGLGVYFQVLFPGLKWSLPRLGGPHLEQGKAKHEYRAPTVETQTAEVNSMPVATQAPTSASGGLSESITTQTPQHPAIPEMSQEATPDAYQFRPQEAPHTTAPTEADSLYQAMMGQARAQVEKEDWKGAEAAYLRLILEYPDRAEPHGELGNLYLYRKETDKAADAYWQAALRLKGTDQAQRLESLLEVLEQIAPNKAKELRERFSKP
jgi:hypothetical protein